jgi:hypothetical protein
MKDTAGNSRWLSILAIALLAGGAGGWIGIKLAERHFVKGQSTVTPDIDRDLELRSEVIGRWIEEMPVQLSAVPLFSRATLDLERDGTFTENAELLAPDRTPVKEMRWSATGSWRIQSGLNLVLEFKNFVGPTTRPLGSYEYLAVASGDELLLDASKSPDRGEESHTFRRLLAKRLTEADLDDAKESGRGIPDDLPADEQ